MRPRFSLRWLLIAFTVLSVGFYLFFVRPTVNAMQFVHLVEVKEWEQAWDSLHTTEPTPFVGRNFRLPDPVARLVERDGIWQMERRVELSIFHPVGGHFAIPWSAGADVAGVPMGCGISDFRIIEISPFGVNVRKPPYFSYQSSPVY